MHPFGSVVMELTIRAHRKQDGLYLSDLLEEIHEGRKEIMQLSKIGSRRSKDSTRQGKRSSTQRRPRVNMYLNLIEKQWGGMTELQKAFRNIATVRLNCPTVVLVGEPNVGKLSIVRAMSISSVNNYPFTTQGMTLGHVQVFWESGNDVARGNVARASVPSEKELVQERLLSRG